MVANAGKYFSAVAVLASGYVVPSNVSCVHIRPQEPLYDAREMQERKRTGKSTSAVRMKNRDRDPNTASEGFHL